MAMAVPEELAEFVLDARYGDLEAVEEGLKAGLEVNGKGHGGATALLMASANGHLEIVRASTAPRGCAMSGDGTPAGSGRNISWTFMHFQSFS